MQVNKTYFSVDLIGNKRTKYGDQIADWIHPQVEEMLKQMNEWDWSKPFEFETPGQPLVSEILDKFQGNNLPKKLPNIGKFKLFDSSKLTDFIKGGFLQNDGFLVSEKAKALLTKFNIGMSRFYPITLSLNGVDHNNYYFLKSLTNSNKYVDPRRSNFFTQKAFFNKETKTLIEFSTKDEFEQFVHNTPQHKLYLFAEKVKLSDNFPDFDLFEISDFGFNEIFVTENLSIALRDMTGITLTKSEKIW